LRGEEGDAVADLGKGRPKAWDDGAPWGQPWRTRCPHSTQTQ
jgi:hypothetical protein